MLISYVLGDLDSNDVPSTAPKPNIVLIVMDDLGYNDVPWHDNTNTRMPFLNSFVESSALIIDTFYSLPLCSMTRSALLTGRYVSRYGLQSSVIENGYPFGLSTLESLMTSDLKLNGYTTHAIGKWHLGFHRNDLTPLQRDFDTFRGSLSPMIHYFDYNYAVNSDDIDYNGYDLWINSEKVLFDREDSSNNDYLTNWEKDQFIIQMENIMEDNDNSDIPSPFFMYVALHASHDPREATNECLSVYDETECIDYDEPSGYMDCEQHQIMQAQTSCGDIALNGIITYLQNIQNGDVWDNTLLIWLSDNGAPPWDGDNSPLRGAKKEIWEGGVRTPAFISGGYLNSDRYGEIFGDQQEAFHVTDLYPTILAAIGIEHTIGHPLDGINQWPLIQDNIRSADHIDREFLYNVNPLLCSTAMCGAYRFGDYKMILTQNSATADQEFWFDFYSTSPRHNEDGSVNEEYSNYLDCTQIPSDVKQVNEYDDAGDLIGSISCGNKPCIFNIITDPCEYNDLSLINKYQNLYGYMYNMMMAYYDTQMPALRSYYSDKFDSDSNPSNNEDMYWEPWIRDYNINDEIEDFENILMDSHNVERSQDIQMSIYYTMATQFRKEWEQDLKDGILEDIDLGFTPINGDDTSGARGQKNIYSLHGNDANALLITISVLVGIIICISCIILCVKWRRRWCLHGNDENQRENTTNLVEKIIYEQSNYNFNQSRSKPLRTRMINSVDIGNSVDNGMISFNEHIPLLYDE